MAEAENLRNYAFISIGSNLPFGLQSPLDIIAFAIESLERLTPKPNLASSAYLTGPIDSPAGTPDFYNSMVALIPVEDETPLTFLHKLQGIENAVGRHRSGVINEARTLDLDLISFKNEILNTEELILPHPGAHERRFVLEPLLEVAGRNFILPGFSISIEEQLAEISNQQSIRKI